MKIIIRVFVIAAVIMALPYLVSGITISSFYIALVVSVLWGVLGLTVRPVIHLLTLPINILTLGMFSLVVNAVLFWLVAALVPGFVVAGFIPALLGSLIVWLVSWTLHAVL